jgi:prepilin signal peptidase PulO-like enzyme (type II secretory pathway)
LSGLWLYLHEVPIFLFFTGLFGFGIGLMNKHYRGTPTFPMAPAIFLSFGVTLAISLIFPPF